MAKANRKFAKHLRKTIVFRFRPESVAFTDRNLLVQTIANDSPGVRILGPYCERETYHVWEPLPGRTGRPPKTKAQRSIELNPDLFEVVR